MARVIHSQESLRDFEQIIEFSLTTAPSSSGTVVERIHSAIAMLAEHLLIGRQRDQLSREIVISRGRTGYIAMYRFDAATECVLVLRIRHQREAEFST